MEYFIKWVLVVINSLSFSLGSLYLSSSLYDRFTGHSVLVWQFFVLLALQYIIPLSPGLQGACRSLAGAGVIGSNVCDELGAHLILLLPPGGCFSLHGIPRHGRGVMQQCEFMFSTLFSASFLIFVPYPAAIIPHLESLAISKAFLCMDDCSN